MSEITGRKDEAESLVKFTRHYFGLSPPEAVTALVRATNIIIDELDDEARDRIIAVIIHMLGTRERDRN